MMLQACRILSPLRSCIRELPRSVDALAPSPITRTFSTLNYPLYQKAEAVIFPEKTVPKKTRKKKKPTSGVIALDASGYKELKARIVRLRAKQFDLLQETDLNLTENPANIIPSCMKPRPVSKVNSCETCGQAFSSNKKLKSHLKSSEKCDDSKNKLLMDKKPEDLIEFHHNPNSTKEWRCKCCSKSYNKKQNVVRHVEAEHLNLVLQCTLCPKEFSSNLSLREHKSKYHRNAVESVLDLGTSNETKSDLDLPFDSKAETFIDQPFENKNELFTNTKQNLKVSPELASFANIVKKEGAIKVSDGLLDEVTNASDEKPKKSKSKKKVKSKSPEKEGAIKVSDELLDEVTNASDEKPKKSKSKKKVKSKSPEPASIVDAEEALKAVIEERLPILVALFDTFIANNQVDEAYEYFKKLHEDRNSKPFVEQIEIFDLLLRGFARRNDFSKIQEFWTLMKTLKIQPTENSYISVIQSFSNSSKQNVFKAIFNETLKDLNDLGFTVRDALDKGVFDFDDRAQFVKSLNIFMNETDIGDISARKPSGYTNTLTSSLNDQNSSQATSPVEGLIDKSKLNELADYQMKTESSRSVTIPSIWQGATQNTKKFRSLTEELESNWRARLTEKLEQRENSKSYVPLLAGAINLNHFIYSIPIPKLVDIIASTAKRMAEDSENYSPSASQLALQLGSDVMASYHVHCKTVLDTTYAQQFKSSYAAYLSWFCDPSSGKTARDVMQESAEHYQIVKKQVEWPYTVRMGVGRELMSLLIREISIVRDANGVVVVGKGGENGVRPFSSSPAFFKVFRPRQDNKEAEEIKPHPSLAQMFSTNKMVDLRFSCEELPMVTPPLPWLGTSMGGYFSRSDKMVKIPFMAASEQEERIQDLPPGAINPALDSLNLLGSVPWKINKNILNVASDIFVHREDSELLCKAGLPIHPDKIPPPTLNPDIQRMITQHETLSANKLVEYQDYLSKRSVHGQIKSESYSLWCNSLYQLSVAKYFQENIVWFPHNMDFRGRVYPMPPYLNHMGNDLCRSILVFAKGKPLGKVGFEWLKLHTVNLTGVKKRDSVPERMVWFEEILPQVLDSANNPVDGNRWWLESDEPWQTLSACCEIRNALAHPSGPENYVCHLPIHQDGSCNGLQHYAALGRDQLGAASVNLVPADRPQDVYSEIAAIVERKRGEDAEAGLGVAEACEGFVRRKVVKQTVMTTVYGVTRFGASKQIAKQLKDIEEFPADQVEPASKYLAAKTFESLNEMFTSSQEIQDWFTECAKVISGECNANVEWVTPLGFPVVQPYSRMSLGYNAILTGKMFNHFSKSSQRNVMKVNAMKHRNGFAPNFIHSLDSCHMMLTALYLWPQGVTYASVHDCYWTHASDVEKMNNVCREQFVALHSHPILEDLAQHFQNKYLGTEKVEISEDESKREERKRELLRVEDKKREILFTNVPKKGKLNLQVVKDSVYFFS